ncbi:hypothetical protein J3Q64DRAFT_1702020 [Phycomyces blakesleeanus]|uniref:Uncharacterized protein n=1 Tax=Phycomyces blakesleeanus TaxID=4837 RepID=A0ABR3APC6_PHYBL
MSKNYNVYVFGGYLNYIFVYKYIEIQNIVELWESYDSSESWVKVVGKRPPWEMVVLPAFWFVRFQFFVQNMGRVQSNRRWSLCDGCLTMKLIVYLVLSPTPE